ncbi:hypothetical protein GQ55_5G146900 [Panicum hallii var. hallii]|uniref:Uncharacterized protein n=1 Tax=Panicum hallii var. hallii TaxID=1504633 RepID=A0A2T7DGB6_9POAL|nr:hypothetical protein GQ55_5G146900 [Panicum hallii var. hallii]
MINFYTIIFIVNQEARIEDGGTRRKGCAPTVHVVLLALARLPAPQRPERRRRRRDAHVQPLAAKPPPEPGARPPRQGARRVVPALPVEPSHRRQASFPSRAPRIMRSTIRSRSAASASSPTRTQPARAASSRSSTAPRPRCGTAPPSPPAMAAAGAGGTTRTTSAKLISVIASFQEKLYFIDSTREVCAIDLSPTRPTLQRFDVHGSAVRFPLG